MTTRINNRPNLPTLMTPKQFAEYKERPYRWVLGMIEDGCIPAAQRVGNVWVIPQDAIIRPRFLGDLPNSALDVDLPMELLGGKRKKEKAPEYRRADTLGKSTEFKKVRLPGMRRVRVERGLSQRKLARMARSSQRTVHSAESGPGVTARSALKFARALEVDYEDLMREEKGANN